jgi:uncharacterized protein YndB with AHSA1/START domain
MVLLRPVSVSRGTEVEAMESVTKRIAINAPVEKVFSYLDDPSHWPEFWPSLIEVSGVQLLANGGHVRAWTYKMAGFRLEGTSEDIERVPNERLTSKTHGGVESTQTWTVRPEGDGTEVAFTVEYTVPVPVVGRVAESVLVKMNDREGDVTMANLKALLESR